MALPSSGAMRLGADVNVELGNSATAQISLGQSTVRTLYGIASGAIRLAADGRGKSSSFSFTISSNQQEVNLRTLALAAGWDGSVAVTATVGSGVYVWSDNTGNPALTIDGSWPDGLTFINNGYIMGKGGAGGAISTQSGGSSGGPAISLGMSVSITNNSYIGGGGGGGGSSFAGGAGGAGGGNGSSTGGSVGNIGNSSGATTFYSAGGGRIFPGTGGSGGYASTGGTTYNPTGGGAGGGGGAGIQIVGSPSNRFPRGVIGGGGGGWGASGGASALTNGSTWAQGGSGGAGGSSGSQGSTELGIGSTPTSGGSGGKAINLNGYTTTVSGSGTVYGAIS